jgi:hypothetical protein
MIAIKILGETVAGWNSARRAIFSRYMAAGVGSECTGSKVLYVQKVQKTIFGKLFNVLIRNRKRLKAVS